MRTRLLVGSEALLRGDVSVSALIAYIDQVKNRLEAGGRGNIPVSTADTYSVFLDHPKLVSAVDKVYANYYPFWEGCGVVVAVARLHRSHQELVGIAGPKEVIVSETGWPSAGEPLGQAIPSPENAASYFLNFVSWARANDVDYFYFQSNDEPWKVYEGERGVHWGIFTTAQAMKPGMQRVFDGETMPDNWTNPVSGTPIFDFFAMPASIDTNIGTFVVAAAAAPGNVVLINGNPAPAGSMDALGAFAFEVPLNVGANTLTLRAEDGAGRLLSTATKTIRLDAAYSTADRPLLYVDAVAGDNPSPSLVGTVVIDVDRKAILGLMKGRHVRGISPDHSEIYMDDRSVLRTANHQVIRTLPFSQPIPSNGFLVSPDGSTLYARNQVADVRSNALLASLPMDITTGSSWSGASIPGGPAITRDGSTIYAGNPVVRINIPGRSTTPTGITQTFTSDIALSPDDTRLLVSGMRLPSHGSRYAGCS